MTSGGPILVSEVEPAAGAWDALLEPFADHTIFHSRPWLEIIHASHGVQPRFLKAEQNGRCIAIWPFLEMRKGPFRVIGSPLPGWSTAYMGPLIAEDADVNAALAAMLKHKRLRRYAYCACRTIVHRHEIDLAPFGFDLLTRFETYWIDLSQPQETLWSNLKSECRSRVRKAEKANVEIRRETDDGFLDDFWRMSEETFAKSHIQPTHTREFCVQVWKKLAPLRRLHVLSAFIEGRRAATLMLPFDSHTMYYWGGASYQEFKDVPVNNLLHWQAIKDAQSLGLRRYDFVSSEGGPGRFKKTFGPTPVDMARHWERSPSWLMRTLKNKYQAYLMRKRRVETPPNPADASSPAGTPPVSE